MYKVFLNVLLEELPKWMDGKLKGAWFWKEGMSIADDGGNGWSEFEKRKKKREREREREREKKNKRGKGNDTKADKF